MDIKHTMEGSNKAVSILPRAHEMRHEQPTGLCWTGWHAIIAKSTVLISSAVAAGCIVAPCHIIQRPGAVPQRHYVVVQSCTECAGQLMQIAQPMMWLIWRPAHIANPRLSVAICTHLQILSPAPAAKCMLNMGNSDVRHVADL